MPTSHHTYISRVITKIRRLQPKSILDIGIGFGKWGFLFREYLDVMNERVFSSDWQVKIDGVEIYEPYITDHQKYIYNNIFYGDICTLIEGLGQYDLIFMSDVLEHIEKERANCLIKKLRSHCKNLFLIVPIGSNWRHNRSFANNKYEKHISTWSLSDFGETKQVSLFSCNKKQIAFLDIEVKEDCSIKSKYTLEYFLGVDSNGQKVDYGVLGMEELLNGSLLQLYKNILTPNSFKDKVVLDIGCGRGDVLRYCLDRGASKVIGIDFSPAAILISKLLLSSYPKNKIELIEAEVRDFVLTDDVDYFIMFDVIEHVEDADLNLFFSNNFKRLRIGGKILWHTPDYTDKTPTYSDVHIKTSGMHLNKKSHSEVKSLLSNLGMFEDKTYIHIKPGSACVPTPKEEKTVIATNDYKIPTAQKNILLQRCNVWWKGGTGLFTIDIAKAYPEFHHIIAYRHDNAVDKDMLDYATSLGIEVFHQPTLNKQALENLNPFSVILHNPGKDSIENGTEWLREFPVITWHHSHVRPFFQTKAHIFVSQYLRDFYSTEIDKIPVTANIPPVIDISHYSNRFNNPVNKFYFGIVLAKDKQKFSSEFIHEATKVAQKLNVGLTIVGDFTSAEREEIKSVGAQDIFLIPFQVDLKNFYHSTHCLIYFAEVPDTWCRVITEALASHNFVIARDIGAVKEQVDSPSVGVLLKDLKQLETAMRTVVSNWTPSSVLPWFDSTYDKADSLASYRVLRRSLDGLLLKVGVTGGVL